MPSKPNTKGTEEIVDKKLEKENIKLKKQNEEFANTLKQLQIKVENLSKPETIQTASSGSKKVKVYSMIPHTYTVYAGEDYKGIKHTFKKFGDVRSMKFDILQATVQNHQEEAKLGWFYIADKSVVHELELDEDYKNLFDMDIMISIINLENQECVDMIKNIDDTYYRHLSELISNNMINGYDYDFNFLKQASDIVGIDIEQLVKSKKGV